MLKKIVPCAVAIAATFSPSLKGAVPSSAQEQISENQWGEIDAQALEELLQSNIPMILVDARSDKWFDGNLIQGAIRLPADAPDETIAQILPNKGQLVVVYCAGEGCPASKHLAKRLIELGYNNVVDYHHGIKEWMALNKPIQRVNN